MATTSTLDIARHCIEAIGRSDLTTWGEVLHEDAVLSMPFAPAAALPTRVEGRTEFLAVVTGVFENVRKFTWSDVRYFQTDDPEIVFITANSEVDTVNGKPYSNEYTILIQVREGLVLEHREYFNPLPVIAAFS